MNMKCKCDNCKAFIELDADWEPVCCIGKDWTNCNIKKSEVENEMVKENERLEKWILDCERRNKND